MTGPVGQSEASERKDAYEPPSFLRGAGDGTVTPADRCSLCLCGLNIKGLCVDPLCPGSREDDDDYFRRVNA